MKRFSLFVLPAVAVWSALSCAAPQAVTPKATSPAKITSVSLSRTLNGWGGGEAFDLTLRSNGTATWNKHKTTSKGARAVETFHGKVSSTGFNKLATMLRAADFFALKPHYDGGKTDQARTTLGATGDGKIWSVTSDGDGAPSEFFEIVQAMRAERAVIRWTKAVAKKAKAQKRPSRN